MSFLFDWDRLDDEVALQIEGMIHAHFQRISKPAFMGNIAVSKFRFGSTPPSVTVLDITNPLEEWYFHMDQEEARLAQEAAEAGGGESMDEDELDSSDDDVYLDEHGYAFSADGTSLPLGSESDDIEYLQSAYDDDDDIDEREDSVYRQGHQYRRRLSNSSQQWLQSREQRHGQRNRSSSSIGANTIADSYNRPHSKTTAARRRHTTSGDHGEAGSDMGRMAAPAPRHQFTQQLKSSFGATVKMSSSSSASSVSSSSLGSRLMPYGTSPLPTESNNHNGQFRDTKRQLNIDTARSGTHSPSTRAETRSQSGSSDSDNEGSDNEEDEDDDSTSARRSSVSTAHSLSSHASDAEIESEAFYTQGDTTIYQRMKTLLLDPTHLLSKASFPEEGDTVDSALESDVPDEPGLAKRQQTLQQSSSTTSIHFPMGLGLGLGGAGMGHSPGTVLSTVMQQSQHRTSRPLSAASFYSAPPTASLPLVASPVSLSPPNFSNGGLDSLPQSYLHNPQLLVPDTSSTNMSNSILGLGKKTLGTTGSGIYSPRGGASSPTVSRTPRGFESPTLVFSRRESFSEATGNGDDFSTTAAGHSALSPEVVASKKNNRESSSTFMSPVEAHGFESFPSSESLSLHGKEGCGSSQFGAAEDPRLNARGVSSVSGKSTSSTRQRHSYASAKNFSERNQSKREPRGRDNCDRQRQNHGRRGGRRRFDDDDVEEAATPASFSPTRERGRASSLSSSISLSRQRNENDIQFLLSVQYQGGMGFTVETELLLNYPTFAFLALPIKLVITGFSFKAKVLMAHLRNHVNICFLEPEDPNERLES
ncbi:Mitochondrial distribution and morphology protein 12 [Lunasporangiospora selenospora]|uniref:Mitochondrial distribution and morphology protein 12 n=1 Tax=Lunasporangiospora selenospora TaxID=979761 RepID=A0A9P6FW34_9FUNG|nr:Mitochondrial distribution and morphology protein 12 [Lunasporangiospora selenospora]